jgi:hypothetical protein
MNSPDRDKQPLLTRDPRITARVGLPTFGTLVSVAAIILLIYAFFSGISYQFYASFLFLFYGLTHSMWISVVLLGVFQTILMIPFRMIRVLKSNNIQEFRHTVEKLKDSKQQSFILKKQFRQGNVTFLFYAVDFVMQLVSYISIGRLFLTDFYASPIRSEFLYSWVPYPEYPIRDTFFKIPYPSATHTLDLGWHTVLIVWLVLIVIQVLISMARRAAQSQKGEGSAAEFFESRWGRYTTGYLLFFMLVAWYVVRHFPANLSISIFSGDVSIPNRTFNTVTAVITFLTLLYHSIPRIVRKGRLAQKLGISRPIIETTQMQMFKDSLFSSALVGLGAFFITNQIPSAFELSIFTLEIISLAAPFTVDKLVLKGINVTESDEETEADVRHEFGAPGAEKEAEPEEPVKEKEETESAEKTATNAD